MACEKCKANMHWFSEGSIQGWVCSNCGQSVITTNISEVYEDTTEYSVYIRNVNGVNNEKIRLIDKTAGVNYIFARRMLMESC